MTKHLSSYLRLILVSFCLVFSAADAYADYIISHDGGGSLKAYWDKFVLVRNSGQRVVIDGECMSACTLVLAVIPRERICVTKKALLGFHSSRYLGTMTMYARASELLFQNYPPDIQKWVSANKALESIKIVALRGAELEALVRRCPPVESKTIQASGKAASN